MTHERTEAQIGAAALRKAAYSGRFGTNAQSILLEMAAGLHREKPAAEELVAAGQPAVPTHANRHGNAHGPKKISPTEDQEATIRRMLEERKPVAAIASEIGVGLSTAYRWMGALGLSGTSRRRP